MSDEKNKLEFQKRQSKESLVPKREKKMKPRRHEKNAEEKNNDYFNHLKTL